MTKSGKAEDIEGGNKGRNEFSDDDEEADDKGGEVEVGKMTGAMTRVAHGKKID